MHNFKRFLALSAFAATALAIPSQAEITWTFSNVSDLRNYTVTGFFNMNPTTNLASTFDIQINVNTNQYILDINSAAGATVNQDGHGDFSFVATAAEVTAGNAGTIAFRSANRLDLNLQNAVSQLDSPGTASISFTPSSTYGADYGGAGCCTYLTGAIVNEAVAPEPAYTGVLAAMAGAWGFTNLRRKRRAAAKS